MLASTVVAFWVGELCQAVRVIPQARRVRRGSRYADLRGEVLFRLLFLTGILVLPAAVSLAPTAVFPAGAAAFVVGAVLAWLGLVLRWWSFRALGHDFTLVLRTRPDQTVVDRGPYRFLRHPGYSGLLLVVLGCALMVGNWVGVVTCSVVVLAAIAHRIRVEESTLTEVLGAGYRDYAAGRARLVPFLW